jgi:tetratricopeptide (TPR) repeat protein
MLIPLLLGGGGLYAVWRWRTPPEPPPVQPAEAPELRAVYAASPYRNARPDVRYVGDARCALCHEEIAASYRHHPMGRALTPVRRDSPEAHAAATPGFEKLGYHFTVEWQGDQMIHRIVCRDRTGTVAAEAQTPVAYAIGSGARGQSYLVEKGGQLDQSPVSWFAQANAWDLSPGFASIFPSERVVVPGCLFCHANRVQPVPDARNSYEAPLFRGFAIGCERCHGPGELHVRERSGQAEPAGDFDDTIVNPRHLAAELREAVCQQCHLQGEWRAERRGRQTFDYRPGLPLHEFWTVFVRAPAFGSGGRAVGHVEQMYQSRCFQASAGRLGCTSCHNPHAVPAPAERVAFYRGRCQKCHQDKPCSRPYAERVRAAPGDDCAACHMERFASSDIAHTAVTDHRILRQPDRAKPQPQPPSLSTLPIVNFFKDRWGPNDPDAERDLGVALVNLDRTRGPIGRRLATVALPLLDRAAARHPEDVEAGEARGWALDVLDRREEALSAYAAVLRQAPRRERTLSLAAPLAERLHKPAEALGYTQRLVEVNPTRCTYRTDLALLLGQRGDWEAALREAEAAVRGNALDPEARMALVLACLRTGQSERARRERDVLLALRPQNARELMDWYRRQSQ